jgi:hypothetical protein
MAKPKKSPKVKSDKPHGLPDAELAKKWDNGVSVDFSKAIDAMIKTPRIKVTK